MKNKKTVAVLATGGTIAGKGKRGSQTNYVPGQLSIESIASSIDGLDELASLKEIQIVNVNSDDITLSNWLDIAHKINTLSQNPDISGFVITHGTDTMEETAYFLHLTCHTDKPIVVTGAMRPSTATSADGPMNLYQAVAVASSDKARGKGVMCVFSDSIYGARDFQKLSTTSVTAFGGRDFGMMGYIIDNEIIYYNESTRPHTVRSPFFVDSLSALPKVEIVFFYVDADPVVLSQAASRADGLVLVGAGNGNYSEAFNEKVGKLSIPVVRTSRIGNGIIVPDDKFDRWDNVIIGDNLPPTKARILLQLSLTHTRDRETIQRYFSTF